ncbi:macrophage mannose receptor 1-like protein [Lates japonicus]|uniref:Macrophage mannose receptor 1-like protein n=1 Tax=Lates japonicus TaxID=270547 RepID=A0AAD3MFV0_LATJO|nr:macrophage mannose receptor 1-like protein [Lates japonicus]
MSWTDAQQYCRENYTDLATFESMDDINMLKPDFYYSLAWIGLRDDPRSWMTAMGSDANSWRCHEPKRENLQVHSNFENVGFCS